MGTFPNGTAGEIFQEQWCARCPAEGCYGWGW